MSVNKYVRRDNKNRRDRDHDILGIVLIIISIFLLLCTIVPIIFGVVSELLKNVILGVFGVSAYAILAFMLASGIVLLMHRRINVKGGRIALICGIAVSLLFILQLATTHSHLGDSFKEYMGYVYGFKYTAGGVIFGLIAYGIQALITPVASYIVFALALAACTVFLVLGIVKQVRGGEQKNAPVEKPVRKLSEFTDDVPPQRVHVHAPTKLFVENIVGKEESEQEEPREAALSDEDVLSKRNIDPSYALHQLYDQTYITQKKISAFDEQFSNKQKQSDISDTDYYQRNIKTYAPPSVESVPDVHRAAESDVIHTKPQRIFHQSSDLPNLVIPKQKENSDYINPGVIMNEDRAIQGGIINQSALAPENGASAANDFYSNFFDVTAEKPIVSDVPSFKVAEKAESKPFDAVKPIEDTDEAPIITAAMLAELLGETPAEPKVAEQEKPAPIKREAPAARINPIVSSVPEQKPEQKKPATVLEKDRVSGAPQNVAEESPSVHKPIFDSFSSAPYPSAADEKAADVADDFDDDIEADIGYINDGVISDADITDNPDAAPEISERAEQIVSDSLVIDDTVIDKTETDKDFGEDNTGYYVSSDSKVELEKKQKILPGQMDMDSIPKQSSSVVGIPGPAEPYVYTYPPISLLDNRIADNVVDEDDIEAKSREIEEVLASLKFPAKVVNVISGPTVTRYELQPQAGISVRKILTLDKDLEFQLARGAVRIEAPVANKQAIGIEVASSNPAIVGFREIVESSAFTDTRSVLPLALGKDIGGDAIVRNLEKMPHLLIAGTTGTGKSVCLNTLIMSILYKCSPEDVRIILVDPKQVEFTLYREMPHLLLRNPITNVDHAINAFEWLIDEMNRRFDIFNNISMKGYAVRNLAEYNSCKLVREGKAMKMPYIIMIVDELADLMSMRKKDVENRIRIITQKSRAAGIHLILATQRPSVDIITGTIKVNLPSRIAFKVTSAADSRTILDQGGAESLLGNGDMLLMSNTEPMRLQGAYVSNEEIVSVVDYIKKHNESCYDENIEETILASKEQASDIAAAGDSDEGSPDEKLYPDIMRCLITSGMASTSMVQRRFSLGYSRASRIIDVFEQRKWVGPSAGAKSREVYMTESQFEEIFGRPFNE